MSRYESPKVMPPFPDATEVVGWVVVRGGLAGRVWLALAWITGQPRLARVTSTGDVTTSLSITFDESHHIPFYHHDQYSFY